MLSRLFPLKSKKPNRKIAPAKIIFMGYALIITLGTILLMLPFASRTNVVTPLSDAFFTATSATCVTGLIVFDTYTYWSLFGQIVILLLIQIGGIGFMTLFISILSPFKSKIGLQDRYVMQESISSPQMGGIIPMTKLIIKGTLLFEGMGALLLSLRFCPEMGLLEGIYFGIFHSISAFCNAGFDLMGKFEPFSSLTRYSGDLLVNLVIGLLIIIGGIGFVVWADLKKNRIAFRKYKLQTKIVLIISVILIFFGAFLLLLSEHGSQLSVLSAFFQSVTARTAGFNTVNLTSLSDAGILLMIVLMIVGGSPGGTAGGIKTTTLAALCMNVSSLFEKKEETQCLGRRIDDRTIKSAGSILMLYLFLFLFSTFLICAIDAIPLREVLFETASAIGTVGLSMGITPQISVASHMILSFLMFFGRVGGLTMIVAVSDDHNNIRSQLPLEKISVG